LFGELIERITVLEIKAARKVDARELRSLRTELAPLIAARDWPIVDQSQVADLAPELRGVTDALGTIADRPRKCEPTGDFGAECVELARLEYRSPPDLPALHDAVRASPVDRPM
jgi:hypothetical protein